MKIKFLFILSFVSALVNAQVKFEPGYIIDNSGKRINCLIKNSGWVNNPEQIEYKLSTESVDVVTSTITSIKEFGIGENMIYKRLTVPLDLSSNNLTNMSNKKDPEFENRTLFLKQLVKGKANLYYYEGKNVKRFFYDLELNANIYPLVYKKYKLNGNQVAVNSDFRSELFYKLKCDNLTSEDSRNLSYDKHDLIEFFKKYNECSGGEIIIYKDEILKGHFNFKVKAGLGTFKNDLKLTTRPGQTDLVSAEFPQKTNLRIGLELEYVLPINRNKWSLFIEPSFQAYEATGVNQNTSSGGVVTNNEIMLKYNYIELPIGLRHYFFLNDKSKLFGNIGIAAVIDLDSDFSFSQTPDFELSVQSTSNLILGFGYDYNNKFSCEFRYSTNRNINKESGFLTSSYSGIALILGYNLL